MRSPHQAEPAPMRIVLMAEWCHAGGRVDRVKSAPPPSGMSSLAPFLDPRSVAVIGASENPNKIGGRPLLYLRKFGYRGRVFPINPKRAEVQGYQAYPS